MINTLGAVTCWLIIKAVIHLSLRYSTWLWGLEWYLNFKRIFHKTITSLVYYSKICFHQIIKCTGNRQLLSHIVPKTYIHESIILRITRKRSSFYCRLFKTVYWVDINNCYRQFLTTSSTPILISNQSSVLLMKMVI